MTAMHWKVKASVQRVCATLPGGVPLYEQIQRTFGKLRTTDVAKKLAFQRNLCTLMTQHGFRPRGATVVEVGTGWLPLDPIGFWMCGAARVVTIDVRRHLDPLLLARALEWMSERPEEMVALWKHLVPEAELRERHATLSRLRENPEAFLRESAIEYRAPSDAARTDLPDASVDAHFSYNVFEHVPPEAIVRILAEGRRVLKPGGVSVHYVDPSDHFAHFDRSITRINFLRFGAREWDRIAGNPFAYHNRLRDHDYRALFERAGLKPVFCRFDVEPRSLAALKDGFPIDAEWRGREPDQLARHNLVYVAVPA
jgi:SAM-dependent methyltransferase